MNDKSDLWYFYHLESKKQMGPFPLEVLCAFLINEKIELEQFLLCQENWPQWKKGLEIPEFLNQFLAHYNKKNSALPSVEMDDELPPMIPSDCLKIVKNENVEKRKHPRIPLELKAVFIHDKKSFRTKTQDVSLGGIKIIDSLPEIYCNRKIQVFLSSPDQKFSIKFEAELLNSTSSLSHLQFDAKSEIGLKQLEVWLQTMTTNLAKSA